MLIDTHCHLSSEYYDDIDEVIRENRESGVSKIIISGCDKKGIKEVFEYAKKYESEKEMGM